MKNKLYKLVVTLSVASLVSPILATAIEITEENTYETQILEESNNTENLNTEEINQVTETSEIQDITQESELNSPQSESSSETESLSSIDSEISDEETSEESFTTGTDVESEEAQDKTISPYDDYDYVPVSGFNNGLSGFIQGSGPSENALSKSAITKSLMPEIIEMGTDEIKLSVKHYHGLLDVTNKYSAEKISVIFHGIGPIHKQLIGNEIVEAPELNFSGYTFKGDLSEDDFYMDEIKLERKRSGSQNEPIERVKVTVDGVTKEFRPVYYETTTITLKTKEPLKPGLRFSIQPLGTWETTMASLDESTSKPVRAIIKYEPQKIYNRGVEFGTVEFQTTPIDKTLEANSDDMTKFEVGPSRSEPISPQADDGHTLAAMIKQYDFKVGQSAGGKPIEGKEPIGLLDFIDTENKNLPDGWQYKLLFSTKPVPDINEIKPFEKTIYRGWTQINNKDKPIEDLTGIYPVLAVADENNIINRDYEWTVGPELKPQTYDTHPPEYYGQYDPTNKVEGKFDVVEGAKPLTLLGELRRIFIARSYDRHEGDYEKILFKVQLEGEEEVTVTSKDESAFSIPQDKDGIYKFTSYAEDHSGNKSEKIEWDITVGDPVKEPELKLENADMNYTVDVKNDFTIGNPDKNQNGTVRVMNANTPGYKLTVSRKKVNIWNEFRQPKLYIEEEAITDTPIELFKTSKDEQETYELDLTKSLAFKNLTSTDVTSINDGHDRVTLSWQLSTDDTKIASAESL